MTNSIGKSVPRIDARDKVTGAALYSGDLVRPDMLYMKTLFAGHPHARVVRIDTSAGAGAARRGCRVTPPRMCRSMNTACSGKISPFYAAHPFSLREMGQG